MPDAATTEAAAIGNRIEELRESIAEVVMHLSDLYDEHVRVPDGAAIGVPAARDLVARAAILRHQTGWLVEEVDRLHEALVQGFYVESEVDDA